MTGATPSLLEARVISLPTSHDRRASVGENLRHLPFRWRFFDAMAGDAPSPLHESAERQIARFGRRLGAGEIGCFKSHIALLEDFARRPDPCWLLVIEDDVWIDTGFPFADIVALLEREGIHYLRLFARRHKAADVVRDLGTRQLIRFRTDPHGTQAYLIDRAGAERLRSTLRSIDMPIDDAMGRFWTHGLDPYAIFPFPAVERGASLIQSARDAALEDRRRPGMARRVRQARMFLAKRAYNLGHRLGRRGKHAGRSEP